MEKSNFNELFERVITYPDFDIQDRLDALVGLEDQKSRLSKMLGLLVNPSGIQEWADKHHKEANKIINFVLRRPPLLVLEGDVGSGKSELATTIGNAVAHQENIEIELFPLSLSARGEGRVGQMTKLISDAFDHTIERAEKLKSQSGKSRGAVILLVDEADALTQSRENAQMHHEDRAGVNAFIRGIDRLANGKLPAAVIMCTNRLSALDPAVKRRAADILTFGRPSDIQRRAVLKDPFTELGLTEDQIEEIVKATGENANCDYGFTFSDLTQRIIPAIVLDAYPNTAITASRALEVVNTIKPTPPFKDKHE